MEVDDGTKEFFDEADEEDEDGSPYTASEKLRRRETCTAKKPWKPNSRHIASRLRLSA